MHKLLEDYVSQAASPSAARAHTAEPIEHNSDTNELRQHLTELMEGHQELGLDADEAARAAIVQFGQAKKVRRELKRASLRGLVRDRAFWQASAAATLAQIVLNAVGAKWIGNDGKVMAIALVQLYSDRRVDLVFAAAWLVQLLIVGKTTARLCPRGAPLAASLFGIYQAVAGVVTLAVSGYLPNLSFGFICLFLLMLAVPPAIYALFAWGFVRQQMARQTVRV